MALGLIACAFLFFQMTGVGFPALHQMSHKCLQPQLQGNLSLPFTIEIVKVSYIFCYQERKKKPFFFFFFIYGCMLFVFCQYEWSAHGGQKRALDAPELELQVAYWWVLNFKLGSSARAASVLNHWIVSPVPSGKFFFVGEGFETE